MLHEHSCSVFHFEGKERKPNMSDQQAKLLSATQTALRLGISKPTLCRLLQKQAIAHYRVGARVLFDEEKHIQPYLASCERKANGKEGKRDAA